MLKALKKKKEQENTEQLTTPKTPEVMPGLLSDQEFSMLWGKVIQNHKEKYGHSPYEYIPASKGA